MDSLTVNRIPDFGPLNITDKKEYFEDLRKTFQKTWMKQITHNEKLSDFNHLALLGKGMFGIVILVRHIDTDKLYAMKALEKSKVIKFNELEHLKSEKNILQSLNFPFTLYLMYFFIDNSYVYIIMPFMPGGDLYFHLKKQKLFMEKDARFFIGQVILALEYLHYLDLVYRDVKPENIVLDHTGYAKLADFGFCKFLKYQNRTYTLCGTPNYLAPEIILSRGHGKAVDWWGIGILMFELVSGTAPFDAQDVLQIYEKVVTNTYKMPQFFTPELRNLVHNILQTDTSKRFGNLKNGVDDIKDHNWFKDFNWLALLNRTLSPPFLPKYEFPGDCSNFDTVPSSSFRCLKVASDQQYPEEFKHF